MRVVVQGRLQAAQYETREGEKRTVFEIEVEEVGPSLKYATAKVTRASRSGAGRLQPGWWPAAVRWRRRPVGHARSPAGWRPPAPAQGGAPQQDPWGAPGVGADEPPF